MRLGFVNLGRSCPLQKVRSLDAHARLGVEASTGKALPPSAMLTQWGLNVVVGTPTPQDRLVNGMTHFSEARQKVDLIEDVGWIGKDVLLLRLRMIDLERGQTFERWMVFDCAGEEVEYITHDVFAPLGGVMRTIRSSAKHHVWVQCLRVQPEDGRMQQVVASEGGILALHRLPLARLLSSDDAVSPLFGRQSHFHSPTLFALTAGEYMWLEPGEQVVIDDVREARGGELSFVAALSRQRSGESDAELLNLYELVLDDQGEWRSAHLFEVCADEDWMIF